MRRFFKASGLVTGSALALLIAGTLVPRPLFSHSDGEEKSVEILVITNPIHTDIAIPANSDTLQAFAFLQESGLPLDARGIALAGFRLGRAGILSGDSDVGGFEADPGVESAVH